MSIEILVRDNTTFALALYQQLRAGNGNLFFSPYSIATALSMTYAGARGKTAEQMTKALSISLPSGQLHPAFAALEKKNEAAQSDGQIQIKIANALWPQSKYPFLKEYLTLIQANYSEQITPLDYADPEAARAVINAWVKEKTETKIQELIPPGLLGPLTRLVLTNAIYFKGSWTQSFDPENTERMLFHLGSGETVQASFMRQRTYFSYAELSGFQLLELPYGNGAFSMLALLPQPGQLPNLEEQLTFENLNTWLAQLKIYDVALSLPRFKFSTGFSLNQTLMKMGMVNAFDPERADFSGMDGRMNGLYISNVLHKTFIVVNEAGTEAAAATAAMMHFGVMPDDPEIIFRADHPFLFMIREKTTGSIFFLGRVTAPTLEEQP